MKKTIEEINEKIRNQQAVVVTAEEIIDLVQNEGTEKTSRRVDVVTTGTFAPMCSSAIYLNLGHTKPRIKLGGGNVTVNGVPVYTGLAAVDIFLGATAMPESDPRNLVHPGEFPYGGAHVIQQLVAGEDVLLEGKSYGTDCYPKRSICSYISLQDVNQAVLFNPRNCYQNYPVAVNLSEHTLYTYMGVLKPKLGNANYCSAGQLSPLLNDPYYKTIGLGTRIFLGGGIGYIAWQGTQHNPSVRRNKKGIPLGGAGTLAVIGDLKQMHPEWLRPVSLTGYGVSLAVSIGIPIPVLNEEICSYCAVRDEDISTVIIDYSKAYPQRESETLGEISYAELRKGTILVKGKEVPTGSLSSYAKARRVAELLKSWIKEGKFLLTQPVASLPGAESGVTAKPWVERPPEPRKEP